MSPAPRTRPAKPDPIAAAAVDQARAVAVETAGVFEVGEHLGVVAEEERVVTHLFACAHPGYHGWVWSVTLVRASRAKAPTVDEVVLLPGDGALRSADWVPWVERIGPGDVGPGMLLATPDNDPRLEPGYTPGDDLDDPDRGQVRAIVADLGLGRERVLSAEGRDEAAERWLAGPSGPDNELTRLAADVCASCGFFVRLRGSLGRLFGVCSNVYSPSDAAVVSIDHGCGGHSSVVSDPRAEELPPPAWDTIAWDTAETLFD